MSQNEFDSPFVLTSVDNHAVIMRKNHPFYKQKKNDRYLSLDCVLANQDNLIDVTEQFKCNSEDSVWVLEQNKGE